MCCANFLQEDHIHLVGSCEGGRARSRHANKTPQEVVQISKMMSMHSPLLCFPHHVKLVAGSCQVGPNSCTGHLWHNSFPTIGLGFSIGLTIGSALDHI